MFNLDLSSVKESSGVAGVLPEGKYTCNITNAELKDSKSGGQYIKVEFTIKEGQPHAKQRVWQNFNVKNANPTAQRVGLEQLKSLLKEAKYPTPDRLTDLTSICGLTVGVKTRIRKQEGYSDQAEAHYFFTPSEATQADQTPESIF